MKYLALTLNIMRKRWLFHVILVMELAALLILTNVMTATVNSKTMLLEPYRALMNEKGAVVQVENLMIMEECTNEEIRPFLKTYPDLKGIISFLEKRLAGQVKIHYTEHINFFQPVGPHSVMFHDKGETPYYYLLDRDILDKMQLPLSCGHWPCGERNAAGEAEIVISGGTDAHLNDVYDTPAGKIRVVGILTDNTYRPIGSNIDRSDMTAEVDRDSIFNYILPFDSQINLGGPFVIASKDAFSQNQEGYEIIPDTIWFVTYGNDISEEDFKANTDYLNTVGTVQYGETLSTLAEESERKINVIVHAPRFRRFRRDAEARQIQHDDAKLFRQRFGDGGIGRRSGRPARQDENRLPCSLLIIIGVDPVHRHLHRYPSESYFFYFIILYIATRYK